MRAIPPQQGLPSFKNRLSCIAYDVLAEGTHLFYILCGAMSASPQMCLPYQFRHSWQRFLILLSRQQFRFAFFLFPVCCALHSLPSYLVDFCQIGALLLTRDKWASEWIYELARAIIHVTSQLEIIFQGERKEEWNVSTRKNEYAMFSVTLNSLSCLLGSMLRKMTDRILFGHKCMPAYLHFNYF